MTAFADLLRQLQEQHDLELANLRLQLEGQGRSSLPCSTMPSDVACAHANSVNDISPEGPENIGRETVALPHQLQNDLGVEVNSQSEQSMETMRQTQNPQKPEGAGEGEELELVEVRETTKNVVAPAPAYYPTTNHALRSGAATLGSNLGRLTAKICLASWSEYVHEVRSCRTFCMHPRWGAHKKGSQNTWATELDAQRWAEDGPTGSSLQSSFQRMQSSTIPTLATKSGQGQPGSSASQCLLHPQSNVRTSWDLLGACLLLYDLIFIPLGNFDLPEYSFVVAMEWVTLLFWSLDMLLSSRTGFLHLGEVVMDKGRILRYYFRTGFALDLIIVGPDWLFQVTAGVPGSGDSIGLFLRSVRILRAARILRLVKLVRFLSRVRDQISNESTLVILNVARLVSGILGCSHLLASLWFAIGKAMMEAHEPNWIEANGLQDDDLLYRYLTAVHFTLTQFTPASMDVHPTNSPERCYGVLLLLIGLLVFSTFISSLTQNMSVLANLRHEQAKQMWLLRRYLKLHRVHSSLRFRVLRYLEYRMHDNESCIPETKLPILSLLSKPLRSQLRYAVSFTCLISHPFLGNLSTNTTDMMCGLVDEALSEHLLAAGDKALTMSMLAVAMLCVESGCLRYSQQDQSIKEDDPDCITADPGDWICEAALWTEWSHVGTAVAVNEAKVIMVDADSFARVVGAQGSASIMARVYAAEFLALLSDTPFGRLSDIMKPYMVWRIYAKFESQIPDSRITASRISTAAGRLSKLGTSVTGLGKLNGVVPA